LDENNNTNSKESAGTRDISSTTSATMEVFTGNKLSNE
jgi:hypothetical protein